jgi:hypothetical protein
MPADGRWNLTQRLKGLPHVLRVVETHSKIRRPQNNLYTKMWLIIALSVFACVYQKSNETRLSYI